MVRVLGCDMKDPGSIPADVNYTGYASDTSKSLGECLRLRSNHNLNGRLAESKRGKTKILDNPYSEDDGETTFKQQSYNRS